MENFNSNKLLTVSLMKRLFAKHNTEIMTEADMSPPGTFPQFRIKLPKSFPMDDEVHLRFLRQSGGYALQFSEDVMYTGRSQMFHRLSLGKPINFNTWDDLAAYISKLPEDSGENIETSEDFSSITPDGHFIERDYEDTITLEDLIEASAIKLPVATSSAPTEEVILRELRKNIRGQPLATATIAHQVYAHLGKKEPQRPLSFLLHGQPGTGKTEAAKVLGKILEQYCEPEYDFSMTQLNTFTERHSISRLIGGEIGYVGYEEDGVLETVVKNQYMVYCFDELEKAHPDILKTFMSILDDGKLASRKELDNGSREFDFRHCIFIFTSNLKLSNDTPKIGFGVSDEIKEIATSKKGVAISYEGKSKTADPGLVQQIYHNTETAREAFKRSGTLAEIASRFGCFVEFQPLTETAKLEILAKMILHTGFEYGIRLSKIDNGIMQELVNATSAENGLTVRSYRAVIEGYLATVFAATSGEISGDSGTYRLGGTLSNPVLKKA